MSGAKPPIGFCGLGAMGFGMATHLVKQGYTVTGYDVWAPTLERFTAAGGVPALTLVASAKDAPFYVCMVATAQQAQTALFGTSDNDDAIVKNLPQGSTLLLASTVPASYARSVQEQLVKLGREDILFIDCPVSGGALRAANGTLSIMAGASDAAFEKGKWLLDELTAPGKLFIVDGGVGAGSNMKLVHQVLAAVQILATSEALGFGAKLGLDAKEVREKVIGGEAWSWMFENRSTRTLTEDYFPGVSALGIILKDVGIITDTTRQTLFPLPLTTLSEQVYTTGHNLGYTANDDAGMVRVYFPEPVSSVQSTLSAEEKSAKLQLVSDLLVGIHIVSAAESIAFAKFLNLPLGMLYELAVEAAGGSTMFKEEGKKMIEVLEGRDSSVGGGRKMDAVIKGLKEAVEEAQKIKQQVFLGAGALNALLAGQKKGESARDMVRLWI